MSRQATIERKTKETKIRVDVKLDGNGETSIQTGCGFFDHMLDLFGKHSLIDLSIAAEGDLQVDSHHTVEDVGICLGKAIQQSLGDKRGIVRYGSSMLPMDESLCTAAIDLSGRSSFVFNAKFSSPKIGTFDTELVQEFWHAFAQQAACSLHINLHYGTNNHHISEAIFKSVARALRQAISIDPRQHGIPSSKGVL